MKLIVVGAGIGGSCVARLARERGHEVVVVDAGGAWGSLAATAVLRRGYHTGKAGELQKLDYALECYERWGVPARRGGEVSSYRRPLAEPRQDADWLLLDPAAPLVQPDVRREVVSAWGNRAWYGPGHGDQADAVVAACGAGGRLAPSGRVTWGVTWAHSPEALRAPDKIRVFQYAPYRTIVAGVAGGRARVGSSSSVTQEKAVEQAGKMLEAARDLGWLKEREGWEMLLGARLKRDGDLWWREEDGHWALGGFHRTGYALAPATARDLVEEIEKTLA